MKKIIRFHAICFIICLISSITVSAQNKMLTMDEVVMSANRGLVPEKLKQLQWIPNTDNFTHVIKEPSREVLVTGSASGEIVREIVSGVQLNTVLRTMGKDTLSEFPAITWINSDRFTFPLKQQTYDYSLKSGRCELLLDKPDDQSENMEINPAFDAMAYTVANNLWVITSDRKIPVTNDTNLNIVNGQLVHREEFGIHKGTFWSPSGKLLAFYRMDQTMVTDYPILDLDSKPAGTKIIKYPMAGGKSHQVTIGIYNMQTRQTIFLKTGEPAEQYLTNIAWAPDEKAILVAILNRDQNHLKMNRYNASTGEFEVTLFEEKEDTYIQPLYPVIFTKDGSRFIWRSRRDGYNHLYLYENSGKLIRQLTKGEWEVTECMGLTAKNDKACFIANRESPIDRDIYTVSLRNGTVKRISVDAGVHKTKMNSSGDFFIDEFSAPDVPGSAKIMSGSGKMQQQLLNAPDPLKNYAGIIKNVFTIKNEQGDSLYCRMLKPDTFDSTRTYPVIVYVYGGPGVNLITNSWTSGADYWQYYMAQRGFIVFTLENRGTPNRGKAFEQVTFRNLGDKEIEDQITGVKYLMKQHYIDQNRMGVYGWSYGGFMSISLMTRQPGVFKVSVAGGPVIDWSMYEVMYTERFMDTPETNKQGYDKSNLLNYVGKLAGKMLLIHGTSDDVVVWQHSLAYLKKAVDQNVQLDYFVYPGHEHNVKGRDRIHLLTKVSNYFFENLR